MKSEGLIQFERGLRKLQKRMERGEFTDLLWRREFSRLLEDALPKMTGSERDDIQRNQLDAHQMGVNILAEHGIRVPGNDPQKPN
jgi:hypothetical protein